MTNGHLDIVVRANDMFSGLHVAIVREPPKIALFSAAERESLVREAVSGINGNIVVESFDGLLVDYVRRVGARIIIRGLRAVSDYEYEAQMAMINRQLADDIETIFLMTSDYCSFISSSVVREIARYKGDVSSLVPANIARRMQSL
ncbi:MAG: pantetheine-phosphate adenylyltransferase [Deltaproteobacteria bacterium]|nr:pantetheine-phosphate adenylyltransferase [Deltaproteobacteria bacterium]